MYNEKVTAHDGVLVGEAEALRGEITDLTARIQVLSLERGIAVRMRLRAMVALRQKGATIEELVELTGMHPDDITDLVQNPPTATR